MKRLIFIFLLCLFLAGCQENESILHTEPESNMHVSVSNLSDKKAGWGFRKIKGARPEFTKEQIKTMEDFSCMYLGEEGSKSVYLTFDEGYENGYTEKILDVLRKHSVPAAFFITGDYFDKNGDLVCKMVEDGHIVGNHTENHPSLPEKGAEEIEREITVLNDKFFEKFGFNMKYLRPPMGEYSEKSLAITKNMGYTNVFWSFAYKDWETDVQKGKEHALSEVKKCLHDGAVILLHAVSSDNAAAMEDIILYVREMGFEFKSLDEYR